MPGYPTISLQIIDRKEKKKGEKRRRKRRSVSCGTDNGKDDGVRGERRAKMEGFMESGMHELGASYSCRKRRSFGLKVKSPKEDSIRKAAVILDVLKKILFERITRKEAEEMLCTGFKELPLHERQREACIENALKEMYRYADYEKEPLIKAVSADICVSENMLVRVTPSFLKADQERREVCVTEGKEIRTVTIDGSIEVVKVKTGKPISRISAETDIGLWAMILYGRRFIRPGEKMLVKASYYFLRRTDDSFNKGVFKDFDEKNIVSLTEIYEDKPDILDERFRKVTEEFFIGRDSSEMGLSDCEKCSFYGLCKGFEMSPEAAGEKSFRKEAGEICFNRAQLSAMEY